MQPGERQRNRSWSSSRQRVCLLSIFIQLCAFHQPIYWLLAAPQTGFMFQRVHESSHAGEACAYVCTCSCL